MGALERLEATDLACWGHLHGRCPAPAQHSVAHGLPPPRQHERMNVEGRGHRLHLHPPLTTQPHRSELELRTVFLNLLRTGPRHRHPRLVRSKKVQEYSAEFKLAA